jgi:hypothetical protein
MMMARTAFNANDPYFRAGYDKAEDFFTQTQNLISFLLEIEKKFN